MDSHVVLAAVRGCVEAGWSALRFNFGGVGASQGGYTGGVEEIEDARAAVVALRAALPADAPLAILGYSFGAWVGAQAAREQAGVCRVIAIAPPLRVFQWPFAADLGAPLTVVVGDRDTFCPRDRLDALLAATGAELVVVEGADHFFGAGADAVAQAVRERL